MYLLDTSILVPCLRKVSKPAYLAVLRQLAEEDAPALSVITRFEVISGTAPEFLEVNSRFLDAFILLDVDQEIADRAGGLFYEWARKGRSLPPNDLLIGASALIRGFTLVTTNKIHFPFLKEASHQIVEYETRKGAKKKDTIYFLIND